MAVFIYTFGIRFFQALEAAGPTLVLGVLVAGVLRSMVNPETVRRFFGESRLGGMFRGFLVATLLPIGSLGVLPVAWELGRARVSFPALLTFTLTAALINPLTLAYALTSLCLSTVVWTLFAAFLVCLGAVSICTAGARSEYPDVEVPRGVAASVTSRVMNLGIAAGRMCSGALLGYLLLALIATGLAAACFDGHTLIHHFGPHNRLASLEMAAISFPAYVSPANGITLMHGMAAMRLSVGAAVAAYIFGVGMNVGLFFWLSKTIGFRRGAVLAVTMFVIVIAVGLLADARLIGASHETHQYEQTHHEQKSKHSHSHSHAGCGCVGEEHNHALESLARWETTGYRNPLIEAYRFSKPSQITASLLLAAMCLLGVILRLAKVDLIDIRDKASSEMAADGKGTISSGTLIVFTVAYVAALVVSGAYVYYPSTDELFTQMTFHRANAILATKHDKRAYAIRELNSWDALAAKCVASAMLRGLSPAPEARKSVVELRDALDHLRQAIIDGKPEEEKKRLSLELMKAYSECRVAYKHE